ncbi:MAG TPA: hypothetical protein VFZ66_19050 [Herpetosiphonaceae bacterium]
MNQRLMTIWKHRTTRAPKRQATASADRLAALTDQQDQLLKITWWYWRHHFLEAKRRQIEARSSQ